MSKEGPNESELLMTAWLLENYFQLDQTLKMSYKSSQKGHSAVRINGVSNGVNFIIDVYKDRFFYCKVDGLESIVLEGWIRLIMFLGTKLKYKDGICQ